MTARPTEPIPLELWALDLEEPSVECLCEVELDCEDICSDCLAAGCYALHAGRARDVEDVPGRGLL